MTTYKYKALNRQGAVVRGTVHACDEFEAVDQIKRDCDIILAIRSISGSGKPRIDLHEPLWISHKVLALTASQFAVLLRAGLPLPRIVEIIAEQSADRLIKRILFDAAKDVTAGYSLAQSLEHHKNQIPVTFIETVRAGEESGTLEHAFMKLAAYYEKAHKVRTKVQGALMYPAFLSVLAAVVIFIVVKITLPVMTRLITQNGGALPLPTRILLGITDVFSQWWMLILIFLAAIIILAVCYGKTESGRLLYAKGIMKLPILGNLCILSSASQFANTFSTLLSSGLTMARALQITAKVIDNEVIRRCVQSASIRVEEGMTLAGALGKTGDLPPLLYEMIVIGEESGSLEETLATIGAYYDSEAEQASAKALAMLEPMITLVLGVVIGFIVIALYLPMFTMYNTL